MVKKKLKKKKRNFSFAKIAVDISTTLLFPSLPTHVSATLSPSLSLITSLHLNSFPKIPS